MGKIATIVVAARTHFFMNSPAKSAKPAPYLAILGVVWLASLALSLVTPISWDVAWRLEIAARILKGATLYTDIIELNPPLWFWSALPGVSLAQVLGASPYAIMCVLIHLTLIPALWLLDKCVAPLVSRTERIWLVLGALVALILLPIGEIGQREPPVLLATLLWASLAVRRAKGIECPRWMTFSVTLFCAYGFALKHYYLIVPIGIELWLIMSLKRAWRPFRLETMMLAGVGCLYGMAVVRLSPGFLSDIVPLIRLSYDEVRSANIASPWLHPLSLALQALLLIAPAYFIHGIVKDKPLAQIFCLSIALHILVVFAQAKGFGNHFLAAKGMAFAMWAYACGVASSHDAGIDTKFTVHPRLMTGVLALMWIAVPCATFFALSKPPPKGQGGALTTTNAVIATLKAEPKSSRVFVVSTNAGLAFFLQWQQGRPHFSRYYAMWMLPGLFSSQSMPARQAAANAQLDIVRANTIADIQCAAPNLLIGDTTTHGRGHGTDFQAYDIKPIQTLLTDPAFKTWLEANYMATPETSGMSIWRAKLSHGPVPINCQYDKK